MPAAGALLAPPKLTNYEPQAGLIAEAGGNMLAGYGEQSAADGYSGQQQAQQAAGAIAKAGRASSAYGQDQGASISSMGQALGGDLSGQGGAIMDMGSGAQ